MALLSSLPMLARVHRQRRRRLAADRGREEKQLCILERHDPRNLGEPLIPADADTDASESGAPDAESCIAGGEIALLLVAGAVRDVRLAVDAEVAAIRIENRDGIEISVAGALEETDRQHDAELARDRAEVPHGAALGERARQGKVAHILLDAEVRCLEQLGQQDDLRAACSSLPDQLLGADDVARAVPVAGHLHGAHHDGSRGAAEVLGLRGHRNPSQREAARSASKRCTWSVMRMAVSSAVRPASPATTGGLPLRIQPRKESISAFSASPGSRLCSSMVTGSGPGGSLGSRLRISVTIFCCRSSDR